MKDHSLRDPVVFGCLILVLGACTGAAPTRAPQFTAVPPVETPRQAMTGAIQTTQAEAFSDAAPVGVMPTATLAPTEAAAARRAAATVPAATAPAASTSVARRAESTVQQSSMRDEIFLAGAPVFAIFTRCEMPQQMPGGGHAVTWTASLDSGLLCLFGFAENEVVRYEVRDAVGDLVVTGEGTPDNLDGDPQSSVKIMTSIAGNAPGEWTVTAIGTGGSADASFNAQAVTLDGEPAVSLVLRTPAEPIRPGAQISITAYSLPTTSPALLGIYEVVSQDFSGSSLRLHEGTTLQVDAAGRASALLDLDKSYRSGVYCVVLAADPAYEPTEDLSALGAARCFEVAEN